MWLVGVVGWCLYGGWCDCCGGGRCGLGGGFCGGEGSEDYILFTVFYVFKFK